MGKFALIYREVKMIVMQRLIKVGGKVRTDLFYPAGFMDVVLIEKTKENLRLLHDTMKRLVLHKVVKKEASYKLCRGKKIHRGPKASRRSASRQSSRRPRSACSATCS